MHFFLGSVPNILAHFTLVDETDLWGAHASLRNTTAMTDHPEPQSDFEKLQFAIACIKDLQRQNLQFYDEVLLLQDENATLYRRMEALKAEHAQEMKDLKNILGRENKELKDQLNKALMLDSAAKAELSKDKYVEGLKQMQKSNNRAIDSLRKELSKAKYDLVMMAMKYRDSKPEGGIVGGGAQSNDNR